MPRLREDERDKHDSQPEKIERTGEKTLNIHHDDGSVFECVETRPGVAEKLDHAPRPRAKVSCAGIGPGDKDRTGWTKIKDGIHRMVFKH